MTMLVKHDMSQSSSVHQDQQKAIDCIESGESVLLLGRAGSGKSFTLQQWVTQTNKKYVLLASTGVAAVQIEGQTIHSFMGIAPGALPDEVQAKAKNIHKSRKKILRTLDVIVIDEISMVRADLLDCIDIIMRVVMGSPLPFGGKQMVMVGDIYQLPPVITKNEKQYYFRQYKGVYFFYAHAFLAGFTPKLINLDYVYRQAQDQNFLHILNTVRNKSITDEQLAYLNQQCFCANVQNDIFVLTDQGVYLASTNKRATEINKQKLAAIAEPVKVFVARVWGSVDIRTMPVDEEVQLKIGAKVMITRNDQPHLLRWVNGAMGVVDDYYTDITEDGKRYTGVIVQKDTDGAKVSIAPVTWEVYKFVVIGERVERELVGSFTQIPLRLGWAVTIHKAQGKTFSRIVLDVSQGLFAHGQLYVALSRCTSLKGVTLTSAITHRHIIMDSSISTFMAQYICKQERGEYTQHDIVTNIRQAITKQEPITIGYLYQSDYVTCECVQPQKIEKLHLKKDETYAMWARRSSDSTMYIFNIKRIVYVKNK